MGTSLRLWHKDNSNTGEFLLEVFNYVTRLQAAAGVDAGEQVKGVHKKAAPHLSCSSQPQPKISTPKCSLQLTLG